MQPAALKTQVNAALAKSEQEATNAQKLIDATIAELAKITNETRNATNDMKG